MTACLIRCLVTVPLLLACSQAFASSSLANETPAAAPPMVDYGRLPLAFEPNRGQRPSSVQFTARGAGYRLTLGPAESALQLPDATIRAQLLGARRTLEGTGESALPARAHYLIGNDPQHWQRDLPLYARVRYREVLPGVDLVYYGRQHELEYDFIVAPGADPASVRMQYSGMRAIEHSGETGELLLHTASGTVVLRKPVLYQQVDGARVDIAGDFVLSGSGETAEVSFAVGPYDRGRPLVIDPIVSYATYLGSRKGDTATAIAVDASGHAYVAGSTKFHDFPTTPGAAQTESSHANVAYEAYVSKFSPDGRSLVYSTFLGGASYDHAAAIAVDDEGNAYVTGETGSADFPTVNPLQAYAGGGSDVFVAKLAPDGASLLYSTFVGGSNPDGEGWDRADAIAVNHLGQAFVTGHTGSPDFPVSGDDVVQPAFAGDYSDAFVFRLAANGRRLVYSTFLGGTGRDAGTGIAVIPGTSAVFVVGSTNSADFPARDPLQAYAGGGDAFVARIDGRGRLLASTHLGGSAEDAASAVAVDDRRRPYVTGTTQSSDFPLRFALQALPDCSGFGCQDAFVTRLSASGRHLGYSTYLGGSDIEVARAIAVDSTYGAYVVGDTLSRDYPTLSPVQSCSAIRAQYAINRDAFVSRIDGSDARPRLGFSSCIGGGGNEVAHAVAVDPADKVYLAGSGNSVPTSAEAYQPLLAKGNNPYVGDNNDAFVVRLDPGVDTVPDVIQFAAPAFSAYEDQGVVRLRVQRDGTGFGSVYLKVLCTAGTATEGDDYHDIDGGYAIGWSHGQTGLARHQITLVDDGVPEGTETLHCTLDAPGGFGLATLGTQTSATVRIRER